MSLNDLIKAAEKKQQDAKRFNSTYATKSITATGRIIDLISPKASDICIEDIAEALSKLCRFSGHTVMPYSVAQHCCIVHDLCDIEHRPWALLHDAHEAYIGDIPTPLKLAAHALGGGLALDIIAQRLDNAIAEAFGIEWPRSEDCHRQVRHFDKVAINTERYQMLDQKAAHSPIWSKELPRPRLAVLQRAWNWSQALDQFMQRFDALNLKSGRGR